MAYRDKATYDSLTVAVTTFNITVPAGVPSTDTIWLLCATAATGGAGHTATGFTAVGLNGDTLGTSGKATILRGTGKVGGDVIAVATPASGLTGCLLIAKTNATTQDVVGAAAASATVQTTVAPTLNTTEANEEVDNFAVGLKSTALTTSSVSAGTLRAIHASGGNTRFFAFGYSDRIIAVVGASGTLTTTFSAGTLLGSRSVQIAEKAVAAVPGIGWGLLLN